MRVSVNNRKIESDVLAYLSEKYRRHFTVLEMTGRMDPLQGMYAQVICRDDVYRERFRVCCYFDRTTLSFERDSEEEPDLNGALALADGTDSIRDAYGALVLGHRYADELNARLPDGVYAVCRMTLTDYEPIHYELEAAFRSDGNPWQAAARPVLFVFCDGQEPDMNAIEALVCSYPMPMQYVYVCRADGFGRDAVNALYSADSEALEDAVVSDGRIQKVIFFYTTAESGVCSKQVLKE